MYDITIGIVSHHNRAEICTLIDSIHQYTRGVSYRIYVVDNGVPTHDTAALLKETYPDITVLCSLNRGFGHANNLLMPYMDSRYHAVVNPDITLSSDIFTTLVQYMDQTPECAMVCPRVYNEDGVEQHLPKRHPTYRYLLLGRLSARVKLFRKYREEYARVNDHFNGPTPIDFCSGCFFVTRSDYYKKIGGFDEDYFLYLEDADFTDRMQALGQTMFYPDAAVIHGWNGGSRKNLRLLFIHIRSMFLYMYKKKRNARRLRRIQRRKTPKKE